MSVRKRTLKNGYCWEFCITIQKQPRKQLKKSGYKTKAEAQEAEREAIREHEKGINFNKKDNFNEKTDFGLSCHGRSILRRQ